MARRGGLRESFANNPLTEPARVAGASLATLSAHTNGRHGSNLRAAKGVPCWELPPAAG